MAISPTAEGFRAAFRRPSLTLAEIAWRWSVGVTAAALFFFGLFEYLNTLPLTSGELLFLRSRQPYLVSQALAHIMRGNLSRAVMSALVAVLLLTLLWIIAAALGRLATVRALLDYFRRDVAGYVSAGGTRDSERDVASNVSANGGAFPALVRLNFLRAAVALGAVCALLGAAILAGFASPDAHPRPGLALLLFLPLASLVYLVGGSLNWFLSLAGVFAVRGGEDAVGAISAAVTLCRERAGAVSAVSTWTGLAHLVAFVGATTVVSMPMGLAPLVPWRLVVAAMIFVTVGYFALADWLYMARLAGYVCIAEMPKALLAPVPPSPRPVSYGGSQVEPAFPLQTSIDRDEPILSDVQNLMTPRPPTINEKQVSELVQRELAKITDPKLLSRIRELSVLPYPVERAWDYGSPLEYFTCWTVLEHPASNTGICYCERGFGPGHPWGLVFLSGPHMSLGMDSAWFGSLEAAVRESMAWEAPNPDNYEVQ